MKIGAGGYYKTRNGLKAGPIERGGSASSFWKAPNIERHWNACWHESGEFWPVGSENRTEINAGYDLVSEWIESPVRTVTRKEIVDGTHGRLFVYKPYSENVVAVGFVKRGEEGHIDTPLFHLDASELRALAANAIELAEALEE